MAIASEILERVPIVVHTIPDLEMDDERLFQLCQANPDLRMERNAQGDLILMAPASGGSSRANARLTALFDLWATREGNGEVFDSSGGFILPNGAARSPDVAWVSNERLTKLKDDDFERFLPLCPDFVLELRSPSDSLRVIKDKMSEYIRNGARLGWLLDPVSKQVHVYRPNSSPEVMDAPAELSGETVLKGFVLKVPEIWTAMRVRQK